MAKKPKKRRTASSLKLDQALYCLEQKKRELEDCEEQVRELASKLRETASQLGEVDPPFFWTTAEGDRVAPKDMDEGHLRNTISFLQRILVHAFGTKRYLGSLEGKVRALYEMMKEARRRDLSI